MPRVTLSILLLLLAGACDAEPPAQPFVSVVIFNNTLVDLQIEIDPKRHTVDEALPGRSVETRLVASQWIDFGMTALQYELPANLFQVPPNRPLHIQAEDDGSLYLIPFDLGMPANPLPEQPVGFPLKPVKVVDLT